MSRIEQVTETNDYVITSSSNPLNLTVSNITNGYNGLDHTENYAQVRLLYGESSISYFYFNFSPNIPTNATINSVTCYARAMLSSTSGVSTRTIQLCSGTTAKGTAVTLTNSNSTTSSNLANNTSWTASEINNACLYLYARRGSSYTQNARYFRFYGATLTVSYTYNETIYEVTSQSDVAGVSMSPSSADITAGNGRTFEILGDLTNVIVEDNSVEVTSQLVIQTGGSVSATYSLTNVSEDHFIHFHLRGNKIFVKRNGAWVEASDIKVKVNGTWQSVSKAFKKENGSWEEKDKSAMFDPNVLYIKG